MIENVIAAIPGGAAKSHTVSDEMKKYAVKAAKALHEHLLLVNQNHLDLFFLLIPLKSHIVTELHTD